MNFDISNTSVMTLDANGLDVSGSGKFSGDLDVDGSFNLPTIDNVENYIKDISSNLSNLSQNKIEDGNFMEKYWKFTKISLLNIFEDWF